MATVFVAFAAFAQTPDPEPPLGPDPGGPDPAPLPVDGGASLLLAAGASFGAKKLGYFRKKNTNEQK